MVTSISLPKATGDDSDKEEKEVAEKSHKELYDCLLQKGVLKIGGRHARLLEHLLDAISANIAVCLLDVSFYDWKGSAC